MTPRATILEKLPAEGQRLFRLLCNRRVPRPFLGDGVQIEAEERRTEKQSGPRQRKSKWHCAEFWPCGPSQTKPRIANDTLQQMRAAKRGLAGIRTRSGGAKLCAPLNRINALGPDWCRRERNAKVRAI